MKLRGVSKFSPLCFFIVNSINNLKNMKLLYNYLIVILFVSVYSSSFSQTTKNDSIKLKPIIHVFNQAYYDINKESHNNDLGRTHLGLEYTFNSNLKAKIILDRKLNKFDSTISQNANQTQDYYLMYLKFASIQWQATSKFKIHLGAVLQNHYITQEKFWGLRYIAKTFQDQYFKIPSTDIGFIAYYKLSKYLSVDASVTDGRGTYLVNEENNRKYSLGVDIRSKYWQTRFYYHNKNSANREELFSAFGGFIPSKKFRLGSEFNYLRNALGVESDIYGYSVYSVYTYQNLDFFVRYDKIFTKKNKLMNKDTIICGFSYTLIQKVKLSLSYNLSTNSNNIIGLGFEYKILNEKT